MKILPAALTGFIQRRIRGAVSSSIQRWWQVDDPFTGAWQKGKEIEIDHAATANNGYVFSAISMLAEDVAACTPRIMQFNASQNFWQRASAGSWTWLLTRPNAYQNWAAFARAWVESLLLSGNTFVYITRNAQGVAVELHVLDFRRMQVMVGLQIPFYLYNPTADDLSGAPAGVNISADDMIHHRINARHHPLIGESPLIAAGLPARMLDALMSNSIDKNESRGHSSLFITAPGQINQEIAEGILEKFKNKKSKTGGLKEPIVGSHGMEIKKFSDTNGTDAESILADARMIAAVFHIPASKLGIVTASDTSDSIARDYFLHALNPLIVGINDEIKRGLGMPDNFCVMLDTSLYDGAAKQEQDDRWLALVKAGVASANEMRARIANDLPPVSGGDEPLLQQQNIPLSAAAEAQNKNTGITQ